MDKGKQHPPKIGIGYFNGNPVDVKKATVNPSPAKMSMASNPTKNKK